MKRVFAILLSAVLVFGMSACLHQPDPTTAPTTETTEATTVATTQVPTTTEEPVDLSLRPFALPGTVTLTIGLMENGSWAPMAAKVMKKMLEGSKNLTFTDTTVKILSALSDDSAAQIDALAQELCR